MMEAVRTDVNRSGELKSSVKEEVTPEKLKEHVRTEREQPGESGRSAKMNGSIQGKLEAKAFEADGTTEITGTDGRSYVETTKNTTKLTIEADRYPVPEAYRLPLQTLLFPALPH